MVSGGILTRAGHLGMLVPTGWSALRNKCNGGMTIVGMVERKGWWGDHEQDAHDTNSRAGCSSHNFLSKMLMAQVLGICRGQWFVRL